MNALMYAASNGDTSMAELLLSCGAKAGKTFEHVGVSLAVEVILDHNHLLKIVASIHKGANTFLCRNGQMHRAQRKGSRRG